MSIIECDNEGKMVNLTKGRGMHKFMINEYIEIYSLRPTTVLFT